MRRDVGSRRVYEGPRIAVRLDEVIFPSGKTRVYEIVEHPGAVAIVPVTADGQVLLVRQFRQPVGADLLEVPAGTLEPGESPEACARRELAEEVQMVADRWEPLVTFFPSPGVLTEKMYVFLARDLRRTSAEREEEDLRVDALPLEDARRLVDAGEIRDAKSIIGIFAAWERLRTIG